ncbi:dUTPase-like protein, partial [Wolfiporia cocos MD-104 SS10]
PEQSTPNSAGYDIHAIEDATIKPGETATIETGLKVLFPYGHYGQLATRSSMAKQSLLVMGGIIDWDYRGEIKVMIHNLGSESYEVHSTDKIAQLLVHKEFHADETYVTHE